VAGFLVTSASSFGSGSRLPRAQFRICLKKVSGPFWPASEDTVSFVRSPP
jgi:hypothetical protein